MTEVLVPFVEITTLGLVPDIVRSCIVLQPSPPPSPGEEPPEEIGDPGIYTPIAPGVGEGSLPIVTIIDTSPSQMIGCIVDVADNPQGRLDALFPTAIDGDGVIDRTSNDIWTYNGTLWSNVGPTPGPTVVPVVVIPPWNQVLYYTGTTKTRISVQSLSYALNLESVLDLTTITNAIVRPSSARIEPSTLDIGFSINTPIVSISARVFLDEAATISTEASAPVISTGSRIDAPALDIDLSALPPVKVGVVARIINVPTVSIDLAVNNPAYGSFGSFIQLQPAVIGFAALAPNQEPVLGPEILSVTNYTVSDRPSLCNIFWRRSIVSSTYTAAEMSYACGGLSSATIYGMSFYVREQPQYQPLPSYGIGAKNTIGTTIENNTGSGMVLVKNPSSESFTTFSFKEMMFDTPIVWTGGNFVFVWAWGQCPTDYSLTGKTSYNNPSGTNWSDPTVGRIWFEQSDDPGAYSATAAINYSTGDPDEHWWGYRPVFKLYYL